MQSAWNDEYIHDAVQRPRIFLPSRASARTTARRSSVTIWRSLEGVIGPRALRFPVPPGAGEGAGGGGGGNNLGHVGQKKP